MTSVERLRIVGALVGGAATRAEIASRLHLPVSDVYRHLDHLVAAGVVSEEEGRYRVNEKSIEALSRHQFEGKRAAYEINRETTEEVRQILRAYLKSDGTLQHIPTDSKKLQVILKFIVEVFDFDAAYTEKEVNTILRRFHVDTAALRRYLVDYGLMARQSDGSKYWRTKKEAA